MSYDEVVRAVTAKTATLCAK